MSLHIKTRLLQNHRNRSDMTSARMEKGVNRLRNIINIVPTCTDAGGDTYFLCFLSWTDSQTESLTCCQFSFLNSFWLTHEWKLHCGAHASCHEVVTRVVPYPQEHCRTLIKTRKWPAWVPFCFVLLVWVVQKCLFVRSYTRAFEILCRIHFFCFQ